MKNILAEATIEEELPKDFGIYDLNQFLNGLNLHQNAELDFQNDGYVVIKEGKSRSKYFFADPSVIVTPPDKEITLPSEDVCFELNTQQLDKLLKAAAIYQLPDLSAVGEAGVVKLVVRDKKNDTSIKIQQIEFLQNHTGFVTYNDLLINYYFKLIFKNIQFLTLVVWPTF